MGYLLKALFAKLLLTFYTVLYPTCVMTVCISDRPGYAEWYECAEDFDDAMVIASGKDFIIDKAVEAELWNGGAEGSDKPFLLPGLQAYRCGHLEGTWTNGKR
jgi:hypothetical protein